MQENGPAPKRRGIVLVAVLIVVVILSLAGYQYTDLMLAEYRASESAHRAMQAQKFADSGIHYAAALLSNVENYNALLGGNPWNNPQMFQGISVQGDGGLVGYFSIVAPPDIDDPSSANTPVFGVLDESGKINLKAMMKLDPTGQKLCSMLVMLPNMTPEIAYNIVAWMGGTYGVTNGGVQDDYYTGLTPSYRCKNGPVDSIDELRLIKGVTWDLLYGCDLNRNGSQDSGEIGVNGFERGWSAYLTVQSREQNSDSTGNAYVFLNNTDLLQLSTSLLEAGINADLVKFIIMYRIQGDNGPPPNAQNQLAPVSVYNVPPLATAKYTIFSIFDLINTSVKASLPDPNDPEKKITKIFPSPLNDVAAQRELLPDLFKFTTLVQETEIPSRININTAPSAVLATLPGLTATDVQNIMSIRPKLTLSDGITEVFQSPAWLLTEAQISLSVLQQQKLDTYITTRSQVYRVQSVGYFEGKGPSIRIEAIVDTNGGRPRILAWRNMSELGKGFTVNP